MVAEAGFPNDNPPTMAAIASATRYRVFMTSSSASDNGFDAALRSRAFLRTKHVGSAREPESSTSQERDKPRHPFTVGKAYRVGAGTTVVAVGGTVTRADRPRRRRANRLLRGAELGTAPDVERSDDD